MSWNDHGLEGRTVVVTGGASGIGEAITLLFASEGAKVVVGDRDAATLGAVASHDNVTGAEVDLSTTAGCEELIRTAVDTHGGIDVLVNNVGIAPVRDSFEAVSDADWDLVLGVNFFSTVRCARAALPHMVDAGHGAIVSIASDVGRAPDPFFVDYAVSKAGVLIVSKAISEEYGPKGIRSNVVSPGPTRTPLWDRPGGFTEIIAKEYGMEPEAAVDHFANEVRKLPLGKIGRPTDVANAVFFLASDLASQVTGSEYCVDGGVTNVA
ncbi:MAG TPA: SDR family NAD(P)-dependent oxidoreductase [Solirubrobacterales bacterium]